MNAFISVTHPGNLSRTRQLTHFSVADPEVIL